MNPIRTVDSDTEHDDHGGLHRDIPALVGRRDMLRILGGLSLTGLLAACGIGGEASTTTAGVTPTTGATATTTLGATAGEEIPDETAGPYPADGSNGPNVLDDDGIVRADLTSSFGESSGTADGVPIVFNLSIVDADTGSAIPGAVVYLWHCNAEGKYSIYELEDQNYLRGVQVADDAGRISFTSIFPGCYVSRWPHAHFEVYSSLEEATAGAADAQTGGQGGA